MACNKRFLRWIPHGGEKKIGSNSGKKLGTHYTSITLKIILKK